jgi:hypothetical protein
MRKGFTLTLMTVAIAMLGAQAQAMAPTISDIPSPIVGSAEPVTGALANGNFVYLDAIDLNNMATDDVTAPADLMWTFTGGSHYLINGVAPIDLSKTDPTSPSASMIINRNELDPVAGKDSLKNTITIRNKALSPIGTAGTAPGVNGIVPAETQTVTFFCSDGNAFSSETVFFYTDNGGGDRLSGNLDPWKVEKTDKITTMWAQNPMEWGPSGITRKAGAGGTGVCLDVGTTGDNYGSVVTAFPYFNIAANQVYRIKMKMSCSNSNSLNMPFWDIVLENYESHTGKGLNLYIMDTRVFPNEGGANSLTSTPSNFTFYWTPPAVATPQWNNASTGAFTSARDSVNDPRLRFRVMDYSTALVPEAQGDSKSGSVCIQEVEVASIAVTRATTVGTPLVNISSLIQANTAGTGNVDVSAVLSANNIQTNFTGGKLTITPQGTEGGQKLELVTIQPQAKTNGYTVDPANAEAGNCWPIAWKTGKILRMEVGLDAPTANDAAHPWDAYIFLFGSMTNEVNMESYQTTNAGCGAPQVGSPQTYTTFYYTGNETKSTTAGLHRLRWFMRVTNSDVANFPNPTDTRNSGAVRINSVKVDEVQFK